MKNLMDLEEHLDNLVFHPVSKPKKTIKTRKTKVLRSLPELKKIVQRLFNEYIRVRDEKLPCISCGKTTGQFHAGHYIPQGSCSFLRYDPMAVHKQCVGCNLFKHGNVLEYRIGLVKRFGEKHVQYLEDHRHDGKKWTREELEEMQKMLHEKLKDLMNMDD